jgi:hypothetical protein
MSDLVCKHGVQMTRAACENVEAIGLDVKGDLYLVKNDHISRETLLEMCLDGAETEYVQGWLDYVDAIFAAAEAQS